ncbi:MAG: hypothetical protein IVW36_05915 [Dehalococcoidia bacterium]|nr:hypothetical protein [Dehalococcoidia bacterium]
MPYLPLILAALACPVGMALIVLFMMRTGMLDLGHGDEESRTACHDSPRHMAPDAGKQLAILRAQRHVAAMEDPATTARPSSLQAAR